MYIKEITDGALSLGFTEAVILNSLKIECEERLRAYCNQCPNHGNNWVCPPGCGSLEECAAKAGKFNKGVLLRSVSNLTPPAEKETYAKLNREHNFRLKKFIENYGKAWTDKLVLTTGGCVLCDKCTYPQPCVKPDTRMNSLSAYGIDVGKLCEKANLEYSFRPDKVYYTALVLIN